MRRMLSLIAAGVFVLPALGAGCTGGKSVPQSQAPKKESAPAVAKGEPKPRVLVFTGTVVAVDEAAGTLTLKGSKREKDFRVPGKARKQLLGLRLGDKLIVKHVDRTALSVVKLRTSNSALAAEEKKVTCRDFDRSSVAQ